MELYGLRKVITNDPDVHEVDTFTLEKAIHAGKSNIRILKAISKQNNSTVAIKLFPKQKDGSPMPNFFNEERSASLLSHPQILKYFSFYQDALVPLGNDEFKEYSAIVMEYVPYGDLFNIVSQRKFSEKFARTIFKQLISAVKYLHAQDLAHLDIKLENVLIDPKEGVKLIDFDACESNKAKKIDPNKGSPGYRAPELSKGNCKDLLPGDIYSLGVVLFTMVMGCPPYNEVEKDGKFSCDKYYDALRNDVKRFWKAHEGYRESDGRHHLSRSFKEAIEAMLKEDPHKRVKIGDLERLDWFKGETYTEAELENKLHGFFQH